MESSLWLIEIALWLALAGALYLSTVFFGYVKIPNGFFKSRVVWITGASSGIGEALAKDFYQAGAKVILSARRSSELERVAEECVKLGPGTKPVVLPLDLNDLESLPAKVKLALQAFGQIDVLINNGGLSTRGAALDTAFNIDVKLANVNFLSAVCLTKLTLAHMFARGKGTIVAVNSLQGKLPLPERSAYSASKHALHAFFQSLRMELSNEKKLRIMEVFPGYVQTNLSLNALTGTGEAHGKMDETTASGYSPEYVSKKIIEGIAQNDPEVYIAKPAHRWVITLLALFPRTIERILIRRAAKQKRHEK